MRRRPAIQKTVAVAICIATQAACAALAALPIDLEVAVVKNAPLGAMQEWGRLLSEMELDSVRLRGAHAGDKPTITPVGSGPSQRFRVLGVLNHRDQLILRGGAFGPGDVAKLRKFLEGLPLQVAEQGVERGIFGLTRPQFGQLYNDFSTAVTGSTKGVPVQSVLETMTSALTVPLAIEPDASQALGRAKPLDIELKDMTTGTALALALRTTGLALLPEQPPGKPFIVRVVRMAPSEMYWPVGWKPEAAPRQVAPAMYRFTTIEITGYTLAQAMEALTPHMGIPIIYDQRVINDLKLDFTKVEVKFPNRRTYIRRAVDNILSQGRVAGELRTDEAGRPFYWVTRFGPTSPQALGTDPAIGPDNQQPAAAPPDAPAAR